MTYDLFAALGVIFCLSGTLMSAIVGACGRHRESQGILMLSNGIGALAAFAFFVAGTDSLLLFRLTVLFHATFAFDNLSALFFLMVTGITVFTSLFAIRYVEAYRGTWNIAHLDFIAALFVFGMQAVLLATSIVGFMLFWEMMSMASFLLVMTDRKEESTKAAFLYLTMTQLGAGALIAGFFLLGNGAPFVDFAALAEAAKAAPSSTILFSFVLFFFGFGSKAGLVPFHLWLPEAHPRAPSHISALMSGVMLKVALYGFLRVVLFLLPALPGAFGFVVLLFGLASALLGVLHAVVDRDIKRALAWSSIENLGLIFTMIGLSMIASASGLRALAEIALAAGLFHAINHAIFKTGLFLCAGAIVQQTHVQRLESMGGLAKAMPLFAVSFCVLSIAASALPPFGAFFGEWLFLEGIVGTFDGSTMLMKGVLLATLTAVVLVSGLAIFAMVKIFAIASLGAPRSTGAAHAKEPGLSQNASMMFLAFLAVLGGILSPVILHALSPQWIGLAPGRVPTITVATGVVSGPVLFLLLAGFLFFAFLLLRLAWRGRQRLSHVWDCGQPVDASMEYTATAFSAPIRFFFRFLLHHRKTVVAIPVVPGNPWIASHTMTVNSADSAWFDALYSWVASFLVWLSAQAKRLQNGIIQFYLLLMFLALVLSLIIAV